MKNELQKEVVFRELGALESYAWQIDNASPKHFTITAEVSGNSTIAEWSSALKKVQSRHPLLNARVDAGNGGRLHFFQDLNISIPLRVARLHKINSVEDEIRREFSAPFGLGDLALLKVALLYSEYRCVVIVTAHHAIADGRSLSYFVNDLLETLSGKSLPEIPLNPPIELLCSPETGPLGDIALPVSASTPVQYVERSLPKLKIYRKRLTGELSNRIRDRSRQHETTVHGALAAAFALALYHSPSWPNRPVRITTPIDARKYDNLNYGLSFHALFPTYEYNAVNYELFWDLTFQVTQDLYGYRSRPGMAKLVDILEPLMNNHGLKKMIKFDCEICAPDILISNLGVLPFNYEFGMLQLESLWGPNILIGTEGEQAIGVATINNAIHLIHTSYQPVEDLLQNAEKILYLATS